MTRKEPGMVPYFFDYFCPRFYNPVDYTWKKGLISEKLPKS